MEFLGRWPSRKAMTHARDRLRELTDRSRLGLPPEVIVEQVNRFLRGWAGYFRYGNSARHFTTIREFAMQRIAGMISKRHRRSRSFGLRVMTTSGYLGLLTLHGIVRAPRPNRHWRHGTEHRR